MNNVRAEVSFSQKRPVWTVVIIELLLLLAMMASGTYATLNELNYAAPVLIAFIPIALVLVIYFTLRNKWSMLGFRSLRSISPRHWVYYSPLAAILLINCLKGFRGIGVSEILFLIFFTLLVGFVEESIYRGLILKTLLAKGVKTAVITSSILFAVTHILNALSGQSLTQTVLQIVYALLMGAVLALLMVKTNNIVPLILFHFLHNLLQFAGNDNSSAFIGYDLLILLALAGQCFWISKSLNHD
ncbi:CPBP family intramembrane metalloprotease [Paenibacillus albidus]|uniref:CPBP family intramembrane glutamic endopeptidase n=1 Tax=Paenibacillus albidus TaxID=2041023 RepID=UPI001BEB6DD1|nr:CPBP family intramembrane glutamic endopeptidase [Paenibacillus albidus]MBT2289967.1 CPBP family intramembrane metalloprotease [Paenibacillus albidus]